LIAVDTNILVYAHSEETPQHQQALERLSSLAEGRNPWAIPVFCIGEFVRVVTHPKIFAPHTSMDMALAALGGLLESPSVRVLNPGPEFLNFYRACLAGADARGNLAFDAQIAAVCIEHGVNELLTLDRDFSRFDGLKLLKL
jgi:uncharacterized protein